MAFFTKRFFSATIFAGLLRLSASHLFAQTMFETDGSLLLPSQRVHSGWINPDSQRMLSRSSDWVNFTIANGQWSVTWNEATGTPHRAYGNAIRIPGYSHLSSANVQNAALSFLNANSSLLKTELADLKFVRATQIHNRWYVSYMQTYKGIPVLLSEVELRLYENANIMAFGSDWYSDISVPVQPTIALDNAKEYAARGLSFDRENDKISGEGKLFILPVRNDRQLVYHLVYEAFVETSNPSGNYVVYVDAHSGEVVWRYNRLRNLQVRGRAQGDVQLILPTDPFVTSDFGSQYVTIGGTQTITDSLGHFTRDIASATTLTATLQGPFVNVNRQDASDAFITMTVNPGDSVNIHWDATNSHPAERDAFHHVNFVHHYITTLDSQFTNINYSMPCAVNVNQTCNANWNGVGINFFLEGGGCVNTAQIADVVFHEYGHGINDKLYEQLGSFNGMINGATHEGTADINAAMILDDPRIGRGFTGPGSILRTLDNTNTYPAGLSSDPHVTGLIIGGTFWNLRLATSLQTARYLAHFAKYGLPDDPDDGIAFSEWFVETLVADDDDGNIGNGTPNIAAIVNSFNAHGIGTAFFFLRSFSHTPIPSTYDTLHAYSAVFVLEGTPVSGGEPDSVQLHYTTNNFQTTITIAATEIATSQYQADIPPQPGGTVVRYYISAFDHIGNVRYAYPTGAPTVGSYGFLVGFHRTQTGIMYAASSGASGQLYSVNIATGTPTPIGALGTQTVGGLAIRNSTKELYGTIVTSTTTSLCRVSPSSGDAFPMVIMPIGNMRAIAFSASDTLYGATTAGQLYRINIANGGVTFIGTASGIAYSSLAFNPKTGVLWASVRPPLTGKDRIYIVNTSTGSAALVGATGFNVVTPGIAFGPSGALYGLTGIGSQVNNFIQIDTVTAVGTLIGSTNAQGLTALATRSDSIVTSVDDQSTDDIPKSFVLSQNYPNPFNPMTQIRYGLPQQSLVTLTIHNVLGQEIARLIDRVQSAGYHSVVWSGNQVSGISVASGVYFYRLDVRSQSGVPGVLFSEIRKMLLIK